MLIESFLNVHTMHIWALITTSARKIKYYLPKYQNRISSKGSKKGHSKTKCSSSPRTYIAPGLIILLYKVSVCVSAASHVI